MNRLRKVRVGSSALGVMLAALLLVGVNYLGYRHWFRGDWTKTRIYSLSGTTKKLVRGLTKPVRITVFMTARSSLYVPVKELLNRYRALSPKLEIEELDPLRNPARAQALAREFAIRQNTVVFRSGDRKKYVEEEKLAEYDFSTAGFGRGAPEIKAFKGEEAFTSAILAVTEERSVKIYFSAGHGESSIDSLERGRGFSDAKQLLERDNLTVATWESLGKDAVPADANALVVAGPRSAFLEPEAAALQKYAATGGRVLLLLDPVLPTPGAPASDLGLAKLLESFGAKLNADLVVDPGNALPLVGAETVFANRYGSHQVVRALSEESLPVILTLARSVAKTEKPPAPISVTMLLETTPDGWGETSLSDLQEQVRKDPKDNSGPVMLALAAGPEKEGREGERVGRLVLVGNSRFASNGALTSAGNANLFLNSIHWLTGGEKLIGIAPKTPEQASLSLTRDQVRRISLFSSLGLPGLAVILSLWVWYRRRD